MKTPITLFFFVLFSTIVWGQGGCTKLQFTYDNAGNRIQRKYVTCFAPDESTNAVALKAVVPNLENSKEKPSLLKAFPNPNNGVFDVNIENIHDKAQLELYDLVGRKVFVQSVVSPTTSIDVSNIATGTYMLLYRDAQKIYNTLKLVIE